VLTWFQVLPLAFFGFHPALLQSSAAPAPNSSQRLEKLLRDWDDKWKQIKDFRCEVVRTREDRAFRTEEVWRGTAVGVLPGALRIDYRDSGGKRQRSISADGKSSHCYEFKTLREWRLVSGEVWVANLRLGLPGWLERPLREALEQESDLFLHLPSRELQSRYKVELWKEDEHYIYLKIVAHEKNACYTTRYLAIVRDSLLPKALLEEEPNGNRIRWDFQHFRTNLQPSLSAVKLAEDLKKEWQNALLAFIHDVPCVALILIP